MYYCCDNILWNRNGIFHEMAREKTRYKEKEQPSLDFSPVRMGCFLSGESMTYAGFLNNKGT